MSSQPVLFILGAGPKIGASVAQAFAAKGYKVALAARSLQDGTSEEGYLHLKVDLAKTAEVPAAFAKVTKELGIPSAVVYNGANRVSRDAKDPLSNIALEEAQQEFAVNALSPLFAAQEAVKGFKELPESVSKTFIMTGNMLNRIALPNALTFGMGKSAAAHMIWSASKGYREVGYKFYYADERQSDGGVSIPVGGPAAAEAYLELAEDGEQRAWDYTFVKGKGYVEFLETKAPW